MFERDRNAASRPGSSGLAFLTGLAALTLALTGCDDDNANGLTPPQDPDIVGVAQSQDDLSTLVGALQEAGLVEDLQGDGPFTVFAPVNSAFDEIDAGELTADPELLSEVLQFHVIAGQEITAGQISDGQTVETLEGETLTFGVENGTVTVNGSATVISADVQASNGVIHVVDGVLLETVNAVERAVLTPGLSILAEAVSAAGLAGALSGDGPFTVFAPVNAAFDPLDVNELTGDTDLLSRVLQFHVVSGQRIGSGDIGNGQTVTTLEGGDLTFAVEGGSVTVNGTPVVATDIRTENAVIHLIDGVLLGRTDAVERVVVTSAFSILQDLVVDAGLADALSGPGPDGEDGLTIFGPTDDAFLAALDADGSGAVEEGEVPANVGSILQFHVLDDIFFAADVPTTETDLPTLEGSSLTVVRSGSDVTVNPGDENASVVIADVGVLNGVIHAIDVVLTPPGS